MGDEAGAAPRAFFHTDGDRLVATPLCRGPWDPGTCHGGPVAALVGRAVELHDPDPELFTVRCSLELVRPVPIAALTVECTTLRPGGRVRLIGVSVRHNDTEVTRAVALRVRRTPEDLTDVPQRVEQLPHPDALPTHRGADDDVGIMDALEVKAAEGEFWVPGPATYWFRVTTPLVDDEAITPLTRALIAADFGNGISNVLTTDTHVFINPDLTVHLHRLPEGEWIGNRAHTHLTAGAGARADADLFDTLSQFGRATQNLYVAGR